MSGSLNKAMLIGNLGRDPEICSLNNGSKVASLRIATSESWRDKNTGERNEKTEWHNVTIFNEQIVKVAEQYLKKGSRVYVEGQLQTRKWQDQSGQDRFTTEIVIQRFNGALTIIDGGKHNEAQDRTVASGAPTYAATNAPTYAEELDDMIPF